VYWRGLLFAEFGRVLALLTRHGRSRTAHLIAVRLLLLVGLLMQVLLLFVAGYLIDLGVSLMELWAELARKHLELTL
jgi:hypothetical protein